MAANCKDEMETPVARLVVPKVKAAFRQGFSRLDPAA
jgi:hypothetical protein